MTAASRPLTVRLLDSAVALVLGGVVLVLVTALFTGVVSSVRSSHTLGTVTTQLRAAQHDRDALSGQLVELAASDAALRRRIDGLQAQNNRLHAQNESLNRQLTALNAFLRAHGLSVPASISGSGGTSGTEPRKRRE